MACFAGSASAEPNETVLYTFKGSLSGYSTDGNFPHGGLLQGPNGSFYGMTSTGGDLTCSAPNGCGTVFQMIPPAHKGGAWTKVILKEFHEMNGIYDGNDPYYDSVLTSDENGNLYGTTKGGGAYGGGVAFMLSSPSTGSSGWTYTILHSFGASGDGYPEGTLFRDAAGNLFGYGGGGSHGGVFELSPPKKQGGPWRETLVHDFQGGSNDGDTPAGALIEKNGVLYGTTEYGGIRRKGYVCNSYDSTCGTVFSLTHDPVKGWVESILYKFSAKDSDGANPSGALYMDKDGNLFGTTAGGGSLGCGGMGCGTAFELSPPVQKGGAWKESIIYTFTGDGGNGYFPGWGQFVANAKGELISTTLEGGVQNQECGNIGCGTAYKLTPPSQEGEAWAETVLYAFTGINGNGNTPNSNLVFGADGGLYGTTWTSDHTRSNCAVAPPFSYDGCGTVFEVKP
jgi:hypothetical protein